MLSSLRAPLVLAILLAGCGVDETAVSVARGYTVGAVTHDSALQAQHSREHFALPHAFDSALSLLELDSTDVATMSATTVSMADGGTTVFFTLPPGTPAGDCDLLVHTVRDQGEAPKVSWLDFGC